MRKNIKPELLTPEFVDGLLNGLEREHAHKLNAPDILTSLCAELKIIVPILVFVKTGLFWKPKWQLKIKNLIAKIETLCP